MKTNIYRAVLFYLVFVSAFAFPFTTMAGNKITIGAHGGAHGSLANTLPGLTLAATTNTDYLELQLVVTGDGSLILHNDLYLDPATDVAEVFPDRSREDGRYYAIDFDIAEIRQIRRVDTEVNDLLQPALGIATFTEVLGVLRTLEARLDKKIGIAPHLLFVDFHRQSGKNISLLTLEALQHFHYSTKEQPLMLLCGDGDELQRLYREIMPTMQMGIPLLQIIGDPAQPGNTAQDWMFTRTGLRVVSSYADGIIIPPALLHDDNHQPLQDSFISNARALLLKIYTQPPHRNSAVALGFSENYSELLDFYYTQLGVDGIIAESLSATLDYHDTVLANLQQMQEQQSGEQQTTTARLPSFLVEDGDPSQIILHSGGTP